MDNQDIVIEQVKEFSKEVVEAIQGFIKLEGEHYQPFTDNDLQEMVRNPHGVLLLAKHVANNEIAGMLFIAIYRIPYVKKAYIDDVVVNGKFRKKGIATKLLLTAVEIAKKHQVSYIMLTASPHRAAGMQLYEKVGFKKRDTNVYRLTFNHEEV